MNWDVITGKWTQMTGEIKEEWGELTDDEIAEINGKKEQLIGKIQEIYGLTKSEAETQIDKWGMRITDTFE